jgi:hypothetical protein
MQFLFFLVRRLFIRLMKIRRKSSQSSFFVNPCRTIKSAVECLESSYFPVRRFGSGYFGKISPTFMKSWCSCQNNSNGLQRTAKRHGVYIHYVGY